MRPDHLPPPLCSGCGRAAELTPRTARFRRGDRILVVPTWSWSCSTCADPFTGETPFRFSDPPLLRWTDDRARALWSDRYGEPMPPSERGRHPEPHRTVRVPLMLTPAEVARLDELRGEASRSDFLRRAIAPRGRRPPT